MSRSLHIPLLLPLCLLGCGDKEDSPPGGETDADTDADSDSDTDADTDADTDTDPNDQVTIEVDGDWAGTIVGLHHLADASLLVDREAWLEVASASPLTLTLDAPPSADLAPVEESNPDFLAATYLPLLSDDPDASGGHDEGEHYLGVGEIALVWLEDVPEDHLSLGFTEGWNAATEAGDGSGLVWQDVHAVPLEHNLAPNEEITLHGSYAGPDYPVSKVRLAALSKQVHDGLDSVAPMVDGAMEDNWELTLSGEPPADHIYIPSWLGVETALVYPTAYSDDDDSGSWTEGDPTPYVACYGSMAIGGLYLPPTDDVRTAHYFGASGAGFGWIRVAMDQSGSQLAYILADSLDPDLVIDDSCTP